MASVVNAQGREWWIRVGCLDPCDQRLKNDGKSKVREYEVRWPNARVQIRGCRVWGDSARCPSHIDTSGVAWLL